MDTQARTGYDKKYQEWANRQTANEYAYADAETATEEKEAAKPDITITEIKKTSNVPLFVFWLFVLVLAVLLIVKNKGNETAADAVTYAGSANADSTEPVSPDTAVAIETVSNADAGNTEERRQGIAEEENTATNAYFTIGSTKAAVKQLMRQPTSISKLSPYGDEDWRYQYSRVTFKSGKVIEYDNSSGNLLVKIEAAGNSNEDYFTIGSSKDAVLNLQGTPTSISKLSPYGDEDWRYKYSRISFKNGIVSEYDNTSNNLSVSMIDENTVGTVSSFSMGDTKSTVLKVQGTPTSVSKLSPYGDEDWRYKYSRISFKNGKVSEYDNTSGNLKVE